MNNYPAFIELLERVMVLNRDNGERFKDTHRLDAISAILWNSPWKRIDSDGLLNLYSQVPVMDLPQTIVVVSSHVDCERNITQCFTREYDSEHLLGTFDNALTNAAVLYLMQNAALSNHVVVAFTGDEEEESHGAREVVNYFKKHDRQIRVVVLDVTDMGWDEECDFTVENNFWTQETGKSVIAAACSLNASWRFVPSNPRRVPGYVPGSVTIPQEAEPDESWYYDEKGIDCFSLCIPTKGNMHSDRGVLTRKASVFGYVDALEAILGKLASE